MNRKTKIILFSSLAVSLVLATFFLKRKGSKVPEQAYKEVETSVRDLKVIIQATGSVEPMNKVRVMPPVAGRMEKVLIQEGMRVNQGDVIGQMSSTNRAALLDFSRNLKKKDLIKWKEVYKPTPIAAPVDGLIISKQVVPGQTVNQQTVLFEMSDQLVVRAQVDETDIGKIRTRMDVEFSIDAYPGQVFSGKVSLIGHQSELVNSVNVYQVEVIPSSKEPVSIKKQKFPTVLRSGMTANVDFLLFKKAGALAIPNWAVKGKENQDFEIRDEEKKTRILKLGLSDGEHVEVLGGAVEGELFFIPTFKLKPAKKRFTLFPRKKKKNKDKDKARP